MENTGGGAAATPPNSAGKQPAGGAGPPPAAAGTTFSSNLQQADNADAMQALVQQLTQTVQQQVKEAVQAALQQPPPAATLGSAPPPSITDDSSGEHHATPPASAAGAAAAATVLAAAQSDNSTIEAAATQLLRKAADANDFSTMQVTDPWSQSKFLNPINQIPPEDQWPFADFLTDGMFHPTQCDGRPTTTTSDGYLLPQANNGASQSLAKTEIQIEHWDQEKFRIVENNIVDQILRPILAANNLQYKPKKTKPANNGKTLYRLPSQPGLPTDRDAVSLKNTMATVARKGSGVQFSEAQHDAAETHAHMERKLLTMERVMRFLCSEADARAKSRLESPDDSMSPAEVYAQDTEGRKWIMLLMMQMRISNTFEMMALAGLIAPKKDKEGPGAMPLKAWSEAQQAAKAVNYSAKAVNASRAKRKSSEEVSSVSAKSLKTDERADATEICEELTDGNATQIQTV